MRRVAWPVWPLLLTACLSRLPPAPEGGLGTPAELAASIAADAAHSQYESDAKARESLAAEADRDARACLAQAPQEVGCLYGEGIALGLEARAHPAHAGQLLGHMLEALSKAEALDPQYDEAGPARVRALVLTRAPGWPLGPGDPEAGLAAARRAVELSPRYPPNLLALAEALAKTGDAQGAQRAYQQAREAALAWPRAADRDTWLHDAERGAAQTH